MATPAKKTKPRKKAAPPPKKPAQPGRDHRGYYAKGNTFRLGQSDNGHNKYPGDDQALKVTIAVMSKGGTKVMVAAKLGVTKRAIQKWQHANENFREIMDIGETLSQAWHEKIGRDGIHQGAKFNTAVWKLIMCSRFSEDYVDRHEVAMPEVKDLIREIHDRNEKLMGAGQ
jgi:hypothetical protein